MRLPLLLEMARDAAPDRVAICGDGVTLTYAALHGAATVLAVRLAGMGPGPVCYLGENHPAAAVALFGAGMAGRPYVPLNYRLTGAEVDRLLDRAAPALVVGDAPAGDWRVQSREALCAACSADALPEADEPVAVELFTSGTTGEPKAAVLRHANLMAYILGTVEFMGAGEEEAALVCVPPYHIAGISALLSGVYGGRRIVLLPSFSPEGWLAAARAEKVTSAFLVPTMLQRIVALEQDDGAVPSLRAVAYGGGRMPGETIRAAMARWPDVGFTNAYGLTETSSTICLLTPDDHHVPERLGSVGQPLPGIELEVRCGEGKVLPRGRAGLVWVRGEQVSGEYRGVRGAHDGGWFCTRDRGWLDADGYLFLDGREDDVIVRGGENISPGEIEAVVRQLPGIEDVAVVGVPDVEWGEAVAAAIVAGDDAPDVDAIRAHVRDRLRSSRVPQTIRFVDALPHNELGKLLRRDVREVLTRVKLDNAPRSDEFPNSVRETA